MFLQTLGTGNTVRFSPDSSLFAVAGLGPTRVYRTSNWTLVTTLPSEKPALAFSPDGRRLATASGTAVQFWKTSNWSMERVYTSELGYAGGGVQCITFSADGRQFAYGRSDATFVVLPIIEPVIAIIF
jgi:WD40 repeat protein